MTQRDILHYSCNNFKRRRREVTQNLQKAIKAFYEKNPGPMCQKMVAQRLPRFLLNQIFSVVIEEIKREREKNETE